LEYPKDVSKRNPAKFHASYEVTRFSQDSVRFLKPKEKVSDDIVVRIRENGVYRVLFVVVTKNARCSCSQKEFVVRLEDTTEETGDQPKKTETNNNTPLRNGKKKQ
jgi:hypothetical protein